MTKSYVPSVFADTGAIQSWDTDLKSLNDKARDSINDYVKAFNLQGVFEGNKVDGVTEAMAGTMRQAVTKHETLGDFSGAFLTDVISSMETR